ncbi:MAG: nucleotidyltransferase [Sulfurovum sp.]
MSSNHQLFKMLEKITNSIDISESQHEDAEEKYLAVGKYLSEGEYCLIDKKICLVNGEIYAQGSMKLNTVVRPIGQEEFDIDLVFYTPSICVSDMPPEKLKELIGNRLKSETSRYKDKVYSTNRGWCIKYANQFHLDITPSLEKLNEPDNDSELVADRDLLKYMSSNPKGYAEWFENIALQIPKIRSTQELFRSSIFMDGISVTMEESASITELPKHEPSKLLLKRFVQIFKRHRDEMYKNETELDKKNKPSSIIITTLATHAYFDCIENNEYHNEYDLMVDILKLMPDYIQARNFIDWIENPTVNNENFAEKWKEKPVRKQKFLNWNSSCISFFEKFHSEMGQDILLDSLEEGFGKKPTELIREEYIRELDSNRKKGLISASVIGTTTDVKANTFYGK